MASSLTTKDFNQHSGALNPELNATGIACALDCYIPKPLVVRIGAWGRSETAASRVRRLREIVPYLSNDILDKISRMDRDNLKRLSNCVEAINDNLITSTPENIRVFAGMPEYQKLMRWAYSLGTLSSDRVCKEWKRFAVILRWKALSSETAFPDRPQDFPGFGSERDYLSELPQMWKRLCPWLEKVWDRGCVSKAECTRLSHLVTGRNFPAGGKKTREESLRKHAATLFSRPTISPVREKILERLSFFQGRVVADLIPDNFISLGHLSLTSSASVDSPVKEGGRAAEVAVKFRTWATVVATESIEKETWFGQPYSFVAGRPRWQTMCRKSPVHHPSHEYGESAEDMDLDFDNFKYEDPLYGLDEATGNQLLQWSIEECLANGILEGTPYKSENLLRKGSVAPAIRTSAIGEPGAKSRVVTVGEDCLTMFLQPFSHHLLGMAKQHPSVTAGLTRGWQLYEWVKRLRNAGPVPNQDTYLLSSDLTTATDFSTHEYSLAMLRGFIRGLGAEHPYLMAAAELLCSGRTYESDLDGYFDQVTTCGILMGDPGAKLVLTLHNLCAESEAFFRYSNDLLESPDEEVLYRLERAGGIATRKWRHFACSGDDHIGQGPLSYLRCITSNHERNGMSVSWPQNFISKAGAFYCEEMLFTVGLDSSQIWGCETPLHQRNYLETPHIDAMKVRLLSPCSKEGEGKDEPNPAIGKARQMQGMLAWLGGGFEAMKPIASARFEQRMEKFLPRSLYVRYLPVLLGGIGAPAFHRSKTELRTIFSSIPAEIMTAIDSVIDGRADLNVKRTLATFATNARARGVSSDLIQDQVKEVLSNAELVHGINDSDLQLIAGVPDVDWQHMRISDKITIAKRFRYVTVDDAINSIDRPYLFRNMLAPDVSIRHGQEPYKDKAYDAKPWSVRERALLENVKKALGNEFVPVQDEIVAARSATLADWAFDSKRIEIPREIYFLPESVVVSDTLCTLRVPLKMGLNH